MNTPAHSFDRRHFFLVSLGALAGAALPGEAGAADAVMSGWLQAMARESVWMRQAADGSWHFGARDLPALTHSLLQALGPAARAQAAGAQISFSHGEREHRVVLHFIA